MDHFERRYLQLFSDAETRAGRNDIRNHFRQTATEMRRLKDVFEDAFDIDPGTFVRIDTRARQNESSAA